MPTDLPISFEDGDYRLEFCCTPAQGVTPEMVKKRSSGVKRDPKITTLEVKHDGIQVFISFSGPQPAVYITEFEYYFCAAEKARVRRISVGAIKQLPFIVSPIFTRPTMPHYMRPIFGYAKVVADLIRRDDLKV